MLELIVSLFCFVSILVGRGILLASCMPGKLCTPELHFGPSFIWEWTKVTLHYLGWPRFTLPRPRQALSLSFPCRKRQHCNPREAAESTDHFERAEGRGAVAPTMSPACPRSPCREQTDLECRWIIITLARLWLWWPSRWAFIASQLIPRYHCGMRLLVHQCFFCLKISINGIFMHSFKRKRRRRPYPTPNSR